MLSGSSPNTRIVSGNPYLTLEEFYKKHQLTPQVFTVDPTRRSTIVGEQGTRVTIMPGSLVDFSGNIVSGEVQIQLIEVFSNHDTIVSNTLTASDDQVLDINGQLWIQAVQNYFPLQISKPLPIDMPVQDSVVNPVGMKLYSGGVATTHPFSEQPSFEWKLIASKKLPIKKLGSKKYFSFFLLDFNWVSCAVGLSKKKNGTMVSAKYVNAFGQLDESVALLHFRGHKAVVKMHPSGQRFSLFNVPLKATPVDLIIFGLQNGEFFAGVRTYTQLRNQLLRVEIQPVEEVSLLDLFQQLDTE